VFSGQGSQWAGMGRRLLADEPAFAAAVDELEPVFVEQVGFSLREILAGGELVSGDARVQPVVMGLQLALTALWRSYGVYPDAVIGHSMGEVTAAVVAGALGVADGLRVIAVRSRLMGRLAGQGAVALLGAGESESVGLIAGYPGVEVAGYLSPSQTVVAGPPEQVEALIAAQGAANRFARRVNMEVASHTALMEPVLGELRAQLGDVVPGVAGIPMLSTVDPGSAPGLDADYWVANVRQPVRFAQAVSAAAVEYGMFIEVSPNPILTHAIDDTLAAVHHHALGTLVRDGDDTVVFHANLNATHTTAPPSTPHAGEPHIAIPTTPWHHTHHWKPVRPRRVTGSGDTREQSGPSVVPADWVCELHWPQRPLTAGASDGLDENWLVIADPAIGAEIGRRLGGDSSVIVVDPAQLADDPDEVIVELAGATHVLYAPAAPVDGDPGQARTIFTAARKLLAAMTERPLPPKLTILTRNAQPIDVGDRSNPVHAVLWGLGRTLALEHPEIWGRIIDIDESVPAQLAAAWVLDEEHAPMTGAGPEGPEDQVLYRAGVRRVARLRRTTTPATPVRLDPDGSHLVVGATGNIGPHLISYLADQGATTIVAVSRNPGSRLDDLAQTLSQRGVRLLTVAADASDQASLSAVFERFGADLPPLAGIYLAAFGGRMKTLQEMTHDDVDAMFGPKIDAAWLLHTLSLQHPVQQFVLFTSISGLTGSRWLAHYTATTTYLDALAYARRAAGLPATAVDWGWWKSLADTQPESERQVTEATGLLPMADEVAIRALSVLTAPQAPVCCAIVAADWNRLAGAYRATRASLRIIDELVTETNTENQSGPTTAFRSTLSQCDPSLRQEMLTGHVCEQLARAMGLPSPQALDHTVGFFQSGMTSLMSVALRRALSDSLGEDLPASVMFDYPTVDELVGYLAARLPETAALIETEDSDDYGDLAEDELLRQLSERLR
jgi:phthiocerol/phenolphthiocerol synthesis type-I polyketide synthase B